MVIQRNWRPVQQNNEQHIQSLTSSSEDSNSSCQINLITAKKYFPTSSSSSSSSSSSASSCSSQPSAAENVLSALKQRYSDRNQISYSNQTPLENAIKSLELLRLNIQPIFDKEIESIVQKFIEMFFRPAIKNIKENLSGSLNINDDQLKKISLALVENSKSQYVKTENQNVTKNIATLKQIPIISPTMDIKQECDIKQEIDSSNDSQNLSAYNYKNISLKRKESSDQFEISTMELKTENIQSVTQPENQQVQQIIHLPSIQPIQHQVQNIHHQQQQINQASQYQIPPQKKFILPLTVEAFQSPILTKQLMQETIPPPMPQAIQTFQNTSHLTLSRPAQIKPIIWNTSIVNSETQFILDIKATRLFGLNDTKERLSTKHPELIRYMMDNQDKDWMIQQKIIQPHAKNQKYLILVKDELIKLTDNNLEYKINLNKNLNEFHGFKVSEFILKKIQRFFNELNFKSRFNFYDYSNFIPLITTPSQSSAAVSAVSTIQTTNLHSSTPNMQTGCSTIMITSSTMSTMSQQGINTSMSTIPLSTSVLSSNFPNNSNGFHFNTNHNNNSNNMNNNSNNNNNNNIITTSINSPICNMNNAAINSLKSRSTLSSTHATLTALLSNHNDGSIDHE